MIVYQELKSMKEKFMAKEIGNINVSPSFYQQFIENLVDLRRDSPCVINEIELSMERSKALFYKFAYGYYKVYYVNKPLEDLYDLYIIDTVMMS